MAVAMVVAMVGCFNSCESSAPHTHTNCTSTAHESHIGLHTRSGLVKEGKGKPDTEHLLRRWSVIEHARSKDHWRKGNEGAALLHPPG